MPVFPTVCRNLAPALLALALGTAEAAAAQEAVCRPGDEGPPRAVVAAADPHAVAAARDVLGRGGSAMDAAIAASLALGVVEPAESGIGGGGFLLYRDGESGAMTVYDGRETAPAAGTADRFLLPGGLAMPFGLAVVSGRAVGVPGHVAMLAMAHRAHGALDWHALFAPAVRLADKGIPAPPALARKVRDDPSLDLFAGMRALFDEIDDGGMHWRNPALADTLRMIAQDGPDVFYRGPLAADIVAAVRGRRIWPGDMTTADLASYRAIARHPVCGRYRHWRVCGAPPPSSGGIALIQILKLLERFDVAALAPGSPEAIHLIAEASRLAYADRARHIGDPGFVAVPTAALMDDSYLAARSSLISPRRAMGGAPAGAPPAIVAADEAGAAHGGGGNTSHLSVLDCAGNAVALTGSIEAPFGSRMAVRGFLLNNQLTDFAFRPERGGRPQPNRVAGGKRPMSAISPTIVLDGQGAVRLVIGARGGPRIIGHVAKTVIAVLDWDLPLAEAIALPNFVHTGGEALEIEPARAHGRVARRLEAMGHATETAEMTSGLHGVERIGERLRGAADPRPGGGEQ